MQNDNQRILLLNPPPPAVGDRPAGAGLPNMADLLREAGLAAELLNAELSPANENEIVAQIATRAPRILLLYGSLRERSFSRLAVEESEADAERAVRAALELVERVAGLPAPGEAARAARKKASEAEVEAEAEARGSP